MLIRASVAAIVRSRIDLDDLKIVPGIRPEEPKGVLLPPLCCAIGQERAASSRGR
jgi:hypothetical protein